MPPTVPFHQYLWALKRISKQRREKALRGLPTWRAYYRMQPLADPHNTPFPFILPHIVNGHDMQMDALLIRAGIRPEIFRSIGIALKVRDERALYDGASIYCLVIDVCDEWLRRHRERLSELYGASIQPSPGSGASSSRRPVLTPQLISDYLAAIHEAARVRLNGNGKRRALRALMKADQPSNGAKAAS